MISTEQQEEQIKHKELMLNILRKTPMGFNELWQSSPHDYKCFCNYLKALKDYKMIALDDHPNRRLRKYHVITDKTYREMFKKAKVKIVENMKASGVKLPFECSPYATMVVSADDFHTKGSKHKTQVWSGYSSMGAL